MNRPRILVIGSCNTDMVITGDRLPAPGETVVGGRFVMFQGGKGANQAVAAARAGAQVALLARLGDDSLGKQALDSLNNEGIDTSLITIDRHAATGVALIMIDQYGENLISVAPGANNNLLPQDVLAAQQAIAEADLLLLQLEIPLATVVQAVQVAKSASTPVLLNPAPAPNSPLPEELLRNVDYWTPNRIELAQLTNQQRDHPQSIISLSRKLLTENTKAVVTTLGAGGALIVSAELQHQEPAYPVKPVDTVGAGDCFSACFAVACAEGKTLHDAVRFAIVASALATTRYGAQASMPRREEIDHALAHWPTA